MTIALPAVPAPHPGTSYNPPEAAHTALLRAAHEAELRRVQEAEALEATKVRILKARHVDGGNSDGGAQGMAIDKPGAVADQIQDGTEQHDFDAARLEGVHAATKPAPQRKTKQQRRKADKLRAEVRRELPDFLHSVVQPAPLSHVRTANARNVLFWSAPCVNGCTRLSIPSRLCARLATRR